MEKRNLLDERDTADTDNPFQPGHDLVLRYDGSEQERYSWHPGPESNVIASRDGRRFEGGFQTAQ